MNSSTLPKNILVPMIRGYLTEIVGHRAQSQQPFVVSEADRLAAKIRSVFGRFDESNQERCATVILAITRIEATEAQRKAELDNKRRVEVNHDRYAKRLTFEVDARRERDEKLRYLYS